MTNAGDGRASLCAGCRMETAAVRWPDRIQASVPSHRVSGSPMGAVMVACQCGVMVEPSFSVVQP